MTVEIERNPLAVRQGAAAVACIAAAAVAMPVIAHRAAEQRDGAADARLLAYETQVGSELFARAEPAQIELVATRAGDGLRARGQAPLSGVDTHALLVQAALRGPTPESALQTDKALNARELRCMAQAVYYEARGESHRGQVAVAEVVMNRVRSEHYPDSVCGVVYQGSHRSTGCQFTFTCDGSLNRTPRGPGWARAQAVARQVMGGYTRAITGRATHYHTTAVDPYWSSTLVETGRIGEHIFYRFPNRTERARLIAAAAERGETLYRPRASSGAQENVEGLIDGVTGERIQGVLPGQALEGIDLDAGAEAKPDAAPQTGDAPIVTAAPATDIPV